MDLKEFVAATLTQIVQGVAASAPAVSELGGAVSPAYSARTEIIGVTLDGGAHPVYGVSFDVAVVASTTDAKEGGAGLRVGGIGGFGGKLSESAKEEIASRVKFIVPLQLPIDPKSHDAAKEVKQAAAQRRKTRTSRLAGGGGNFATRW